MRGLVVNTRLALLVFGALKVLQGDRLGGEIALILKENGSQAVIAFIKAPEPIIRITRFIL